MTGLGAKLPLKLKNMAKWLNMAANWKHRDDLPIDYSAHKLPTAEKRRSLG